MNEYVKFSCASNSLMVSLFSDHSNSEVARLLTEQRIKEKESKKRRLENILQALGNCQERKTIQKMLDKVKSEKVLVSASMVKQRAKRLKLKKSPSYIMKLNKDKAKNKNLIIKSESAEIIGNVMAWLRTIPDYKTKYGKLKDSKQISTIKTELSRFNHKECIPRGFCISLEYYSEYKLVKVTSKPYV